MFRFISGLCLLTATLSAAQAVVPAPAPQLQQAASGVTSPSDGPAASQAVPVLGYGRIQRGQFDAAADLLVYRFYAYPETGIEVTLRSEQLAQEALEIFTPQGDPVALERIEGERLGQFGTVYRARLLEPGMHLLAVHGTQAGPESSLASYELHLQCVSGPCPPVATATPRNGSGVNRMCYTNEVPPLVGGSWRANIDTSGHSDVLRTFVVLHPRPSGGQEPYMTPQGEVLFEPGLPPFCEFSCELDACEQLVPNDPNIFGMRFATQAIIVGRDAIELCNAIDMIVGF